MPTSTSPLHVAVDCRVVDPHYPGIGRATLETVRALAREPGPHRLSLLVGPGAPPADLADVTRSANVDAQLVRVGSALRSPADQWELPRLLWRLRPDVYHATYYAVPALLPVPTVVTIYDLIPRLFPRYWTNPALRGVINAWTAYAARRAARVLTCSHATARDLARLLPETAPKLRVVPLGVSPRPAARVDASRSSDDPTLLYVGSNKPHKNLPRLVAAFARVAPTVTGTLVVAGAWDERYSEAVDLARRLNLDERVRFERRPSDERLDALFAAATGFVFPSLYEGFGLPVLEAMAAGLPVATSDRGSLAEVAGDAALLVDPDDEGSIADAMRRLLRDAAERSRLSAAGRAQAARFTWDRTAEETWALYEEAA